MLKTIHAVNFLLLWGININRYNKWNKLTRKRCAGRRSRCLWRWLSLSKPPEQTMSVSGTRNVATPSGVDTWGNDQKNQILFISTVIQVQPCNIRVRIFQSQHHEFSAILKHFQKSSEPAPQNLQELGLQCRFLLSGLRLLAERQFFLLLQDSG